MGKILPVPTLVYTKHEIRYEIKKSRPSLLHTSETGRPTTKLNAYGTIHISYKVYKFDAYGTKKILILYN